MKRDFSRVRLCVLVSDGVSPLPLKELVRRIVAGGADCIQLREKNTPDKTLLQHALECREAAGDAIFLVNDRADIAVLSGADGVHLGQTDLPAPEARKLIGPGRLIGVSASCPEEIEAAQSAGADYLGVGAVFPTETKAVAARGPDLLRAASAAAKVPWLAIGGITPRNVREAVRAGAPGVAVFSSVVKSADPRGAAEAMKAAVLEALSQT